MPKSTDRAGQSATVRSIWSGTISFGLVNIPVDLLAAVRGRAISMKMVDTKGRALGRQYTCSKDQKKLSMDDIVRGYEADDGEMIVVTDEELESVAPEKTRDITLMRFVPFDQIPPIYFQRPYFLAPSGRSTKAYHLLAETMEKSRRVGIGSFVMRDHEYLVAILSDGGLLRAETLRFADELRSPADVGMPAPGRTAGSRVKQFSRAIAKLSRDSLDAEEVSDWYAQAIRELAEQKRKQGKDVVDVDASAEDEDPETGANVIDLVKLIKQRLSTNAKVQVGLSDSDDAPPGSTDLERLSKDELYERAKTLDLPGRSKMGKKRLVQALRKAA